MDLAKNSNSSSAKVLAMEFNKIIKEPVEGFNISLKDDSDLYDWKVAIFGPPKTLYEGGYFKAEMTFPKDYPYRKKLKKN
jgi:ubiquitin-conjugating enzyme E2 R